MYITKQGGKRKLISSEPQKQAMNPGHPVSARTAAAPAILDINTDWEVLLPLAQDGDTRALLLLCSKALPLRDAIVSKPYFMNTLGKDEACSIASKTMIEWLLLEPLKNAGKDIPKLLIRAMKCDLINQAHRLERRRRYEKANRFRPQAEAEDEEDKDELASLAADSREEPENRLLQAEWNRKVQECIKQLRPKEQTVINGLFFRQLSVTEIARELGCTTGSVTMTKRRAMEKLITYNIFRKNKIK